MLVGWKSPWAVNSEPFLTLLRLAVELTFWGLTALISTLNADELCLDALTGPGPPWQQETHCFASLLGHVHLSVYWVCVRAEREEVHDQLTWVRGAKHEARWGIKARASSSPLPLSPQVWLSPGEPLTPSEGIPPGSINRIIGGFKRTLWLIRQRVIVPFTVYFPFSLSVTQV